jgi:hypothetical protein
MPAETSSKRGTRSFIDLNPSIHDQSHQDDLGSLQNFPKLKGLFIRCEWERSLTHLEEPITTSSLQRIRKVCAKNVVVIDMFNFLSYSSFQRGTGDLSLEALPNARQRSTRHLHHATPSALYHLLSCKVLLEKPCWKLAVSKTPRTVKWRMQSSSHKDPDTGAQVLRNTYHRDEIYSGDQVEYAGDIQLTFSSGYRTSWQTSLRGVRVMTYRPGTALAARSSSRDLID